MSSEKSNCPRALKNRRPIPGHAKIVSVTTAPEKSPGSESATIVTTGINAFLRPWRAITVRRSSPLAAAVRM